MATFTSWITGKYTQVVPITTSAGAGDASKMVQTGTDGKFDASVMADGIAPDQKSGTSNGTITINDICYPETAGTIARATAAAGTPHQGVGWATASVATAQPCTIRLDGIITGLSGLTPGARYFLSDVTPGGILIAPGPTGVGKIAQYIGTALSATELEFEPDNNPLWLAA